MRRSHSISEAEDTEKSRELLYLVFILGKLEQYKRRPKVNEIIKELNKSLDSETSSADRTMSINRVRRLMHALYLQEAQRTFENEGGRIKGDYELCQALCQFLLLLAKYHPLNALEANDPICPITMLPIDPDSRLLTTYGRQYDRIALATHLGKGSRREPVANIDFSLHEYVFLKSRCNDPNRKELLDPDEALFEQKNQANCCKTLLTRWEDCVSENKKGAYASMGFSWIIFAAALAYSCVEGLIPGGSNQKPYDSYSSFDDFVVGTMDATLPFISAPFWLTLGAALQISFRRCSERASYALYGEDLDINQAPYLLELLQKVELELVIDDIEEKKVSPQDDISLPAEAAPRADAVAQPSARSKPSAPPPPDATSSSLTSSSALFGSPPPTPTSQSAEADNLRQPLLSPQENKLPNDEVVKKVERSGPKKG